MSATTSGPSVADPAGTPPTPPATPDQDTPKKPMRSLPESMWSQSFIYGMFMLPIAAGVLIGAFKYLDQAVVATLAGVAINKLLSPSDFFYGGSKHPPAPEPTPGVTTTTTTAPP